jgi:hypothetical protein
MPVAARKPRTPATPPPEPVKEDGQFTATVGGLSFEMRPMNESQWAVLTKVSTIADRVNTSQANTRAIEVFFNILERLLINPTVDLVRLEDGLVDGSITVEALAKAIEGKKNGTAKPAPARTRRGQ